MKLTDNNIHALQYLIHNEFSDYQDYLLNMGYNFDGLLDIDSKVFHDALNDDNVEHIYKFAYLALQGK